MKSLNGTKFRYSVWILSGLMLSGFWCSVGISRGLEYTWTQKADMPIARWLHSTDVLDAKIYVIGGAASEPGTELILPVEVYDPTTDSWIQKANMPTGRGVLSTAVVNRKIYAIGGVRGNMSGLSAMEVFDPEMDTWSIKTDLSTPRAALAVSAVDGKIYVIGGATSLANPIGLPMVEVYDPATNTWTRKAEMLTPRYGLCSSVVDGKIYAIGGATGVPNTLGLSTVEAYDPATDTWTRKAEMPTARRNFSTCVLAGRIYAFGGWDRSGNYPYPAVEQYNPVTDTWTTEAEMPFARSCFSTSVVDGRIYAIGGTFKPHPCPALSTMYEITISGSPIDFNGNGFVDIKDLLRLIESWGQDDPMVDIAPTPFGDDFVDALDLELLMSYWEQSVDDPTLITHWSLDETEGIFAYDSAGLNDAVVLGGTAWKPSGGQVDGALQLDGVDGCAIANQVLNPADGPFSIFAWVKGGAPGQVILSQQGLANWLTAYADGNLMTELEGTGRSAAPLLSETIITDGEWHRIGFVWDGSNRALYVDDILVAEDTQANLQGSDSSMYIGTGKAMESGTYFSGLIDDIRIYNRAMSP